MGVNRFEKTLKTNIPRVITRLSETLNIDKELATSMLYSSKTYALLSDYNTGLWRMTIEYITSMALQEVSVSTYC